MVSHMVSVAFAGIDVTAVHIQVQLTSGLPNIVIVGLPDKAVAESRERVKAAISAMGLSFPAKRIVVNLSPADLIKEGSHFDLPIALALLQAMQVIPEDALRDYWAMGELSLDGKILPVSGVLPAVMQATQEGAGMICPALNGPEAAWANPEQAILAPDSLLAFINHVKGTQTLTPPIPAMTHEAHHVPDLGEVKGQETAKRALEVAAAGGHNMLMSGPPGAGKSMLASCLPGILPPLSSKEILEVSTIASIAGTLKEGKLTSQRPFRAPHHSSSMPAMIGGGRKAKPGEISLAHRGVLFLDELPEYQPNVLESLRQPLENGTVSIARAEMHITYPANVQLIAAMNPCRCGYLDDPARACNKAPLCARQYQSRLSGPLLDRIDMHIDIAAVDTLDMLALPNAEPSHIVAQRVASARDIQKARYGSVVQGVATNACATGDMLRENAVLDEDSTQLLEDAVRKMKLSMRGYTRTLRVARTIADLDNADDIARHHIAEALSYRIQAADIF